jgi:hypothetical protein
VTTRSETHKRCREKRGGIRRRIRNLPPSAAFWCFGLAFVGMGFAFGFGLPDVVLGIIGFGFVGLGFVLLVLNRDFAPGSWPDVSTPPFPPGGDGGGS